MIKRRISGLAWHCHHDQLVEYVWSYDERVASIRKEKPEDEQEVRLRLFKMIPKNRIPGLRLREWAAYAKAGAICTKEWAAYIKVGAIYDKTWAAYAKARAYAKAGAVCTKEWAACTKAWAAYITGGLQQGKARAVYDKAGAAYLAKHENEIMALHAELCLDCPWNGETILAAQVGG